MGNIIFRHGTMASGKTTLLLQTHFNLNEAFPGQVMLLNKNDRCGNNICSSRTGASQIATTVKDGDVICDLVDAYEKEKTLSVSSILVDEIQFFSEDQVDSLAWLADTRDINVYIFGLLTSYKGHIFPASRRSLEIADEIKQIKNNKRCWCGSPATHNALFVSGRRAYDGVDTIVDNNSVIDYQVVCRKHFMSNGSGE
jgi:thymidine kinase